MNATHTAERLQSYFDFDESVIADVSEAADRQNRQSYIDLCYEYDIHNAYKSAPIYPHLKPLDILEITPKGDFDEKHAIVAHFSMGKTINHRMVMNAMRLFGADSSKQLILVGNPSVPTRNSGVVTAPGAVGMMMANSLRPAANKTLTYLQSRGITSADHYGYSYGADKAAATVAHAHAYGQQVTKAVFVEPVSAEKQSPAQLIRKFRTIGKHQQIYVEQTNSPPYLEISEEDSRLYKIAFAAGLCRLSNVAITKVLASGGYEKRLRQSLDAEPGVVTTTAWGTESELSDDKLLTGITNAVRADYGSDRVKSMRLKGMRHVGGYDIDLTAAIILQGLRA